MRENASRKGEKIMRVIEPEKRDYADNILIIPKETLFIGGRIMFLCEVDDGMFRTEKLIYEDYGAFYIAKEDPDPAFEKEKYRSNNIFQAMNIFDLGYNGDPLPEEISFQKKLKKQKNNSETEFHAKDSAFKSIKDDMQPSDSSRIENSIMPSEKREDKEKYEFVASDGRTKIFCITDQDSEVVPILNDRCNIVGFLKLPE